MCGGNEYDDFIKRHIGVSMNIQQATKFQEILDKMPTGSDTKYGWVDSRTKKPIVFGVNHSYKIHGRKPR